MKTIKLLLVAAAGSMMISCGGIIDDINDIIDEHSSEAYEKEQDEISEGAFFQVKAATVEYSDGTTLAFDNYGKEGYVITDNNTMMLVKDGFTYIANLSTQQYQKTEGSEFSAASAFVFQEASYRYLSQSPLGIYYRDLKESKVTIAGKSCVDFIYSVEGESLEIAGWNRIVMRRKLSSDSEGLEATSIKESATIALPDGLTEIKY